MRYRTIALTLAAAFSVACYGESAEDTAPASEAATLSPDEQALDDVRAYWETHYNMGHASMVASTYAEDAWSLPANGGVRMGPAEIEADLAASLEASPTATIAGGEMMVMGDMAAGMGTYGVEVSPEGGESMNWSGAYLNVMTKESGEWKLLGSITNYDEAPPEGWSWYDSDDEAPANEGTMGDVVDYYATHWNMGHASMVASVYTEDAIMSFSNGPILRGKAAIEADLEARIPEGATLTINDVGTLPLAEGWAVDGGWYLIEAGDGSGPVQTGSYMNIMQQQEDGTWKIHWGLTNAQPVPAM